MSPPDDDTVRIPRKAARPAPFRRLLLPGVLALGLLAAGAGFAGFWFWPSAPVPPASSAIRTIPVRIADEATIRANRPTNLDVFRFAPNPRILVIDFATLARQGAMLNRVAAMTEKIGLPHEHPLDDAELDRAIRAGGDTAEDFYYGHDYGAVELTRFFAAADRRKLTLTPEEEWLRGLLRQEGFFEPGALRSLITIPATGAAADIDAATRAAILRHELAHGEYFSNPAYAAWVLRFWHEWLDDSERAAFAHFLVAKNYDPEVPGLLANEAQAYLLFTPDIRLFTPAMLGLDAAQATRLQRLFRANMPPGWLRDSVPETVQR